MSLHVPAIALAADDGDGAVRYARCMAEARANPAAALASANTWRAAGGGTPAGHCQATALIGLDQYTEGASRLEKLAESVEPGHSTLKAELFAQAGRTWLTAGNAGRALAAQTRALALKPDSVELLIDRSISLVSAGRLWKAVDDLTAALERDPGRADVLVFRAAAWRRLDSPDLADDDVRRALALKPGDAGALIERGHVHLRRGRRNAAREDWLAVLRANAAGPAADTARALIEQLDVRKD